MMLCRVQQVLGLFLWLYSVLSSTTAFTSPLAGRWGGRQQQDGMTRLTMANKNPTTFREAEVLGLKLMQEQKYAEALDAFKKSLQLPGSKIDVIRTKALSGPSPVGGSMGGFESKNIVTLDEYELQAANYNMACAHAQLGQIVEAVAALQASFENGFDNYATVRADPDLSKIQSSDAFRALMDQYEPKSKGFNPFGFFGRK